MNLIYLLLYLMDYIRESRRHPGRLKGGSGGGRSPQENKYILFLGLLTEAENLGGQMVAISLLRALRRILRLSFHYWRSSDEILQPRPCCTRQQAPGRGTEFQALATRYQILSSGFLVPGTKYLA